MAQFQDLAKRWYESRKKLAGKLSARVLVAWRAFGKDQAKVFLSGAFGELWARYGEDAVAVVRGLRDREIPLLPGESKSTAFLRVLADRNTDGRVTLGDLPDRWLNRMRETALGIVENADGDPALEDAVRRLTEALEDGD